MRRASASWCACALVLALGLATAAVSARNRARASQLDRLERWCEIQSRRNELLSVEIARREWNFLSRRLTPGAAEERRASP